MRIAWLLLLLVAMDAAAQSGVGRLFFTPEERTRLEARKAKDAAKSPADDSLPALPETMDEPRARKYQGFLRRDDGTTIWWVDDRPTDTAPPEAKKTPPLQDEKRASPGSATPSE